jgi:HSP20 family molecular chaperone IbpA
MDQYKVTIITIFAITFCLMCNFTKAFIPTTKTPIGSDGKINLDAVTSSSGLFDNFDFGVSQLGGIMGEMAEDLTPSVWCPVNNRFQDINSMMQPLPRVSSEIQEYDSFYTVNCQLSNVLSRDDVKIDLSSTDYFHIRIPYGTISTTQEHNGVKHTVKLPQNVNRNDIKAKFLDDSNLQITLPKYTDIKIEISS